MLDQAAFETMSFYEGAAVAVICSARKVSAAELTELMDGIVFSKGDKDYDEAVKMMKMFQAMLEMKFKEKRFRPGYLLSKTVDIDKAALWCDGFSSMFFKVNGKDSIRNDQYLSKAIFPFVFVSGRADADIKEQFKDKYPTQADFDGFKLSIASRIDEAVNAIYNYNHPTGLQADSAKTGRNADCPCGSGKKYKKCCGK